MVSRNKIVLFVHLEQCKQNRLLYRSIKQSHQVLTLHGGNLQNDPYRSELLHKQNYLTQITIIKCYLLCVVL